jgi:hypothetical protein
MSAFNVEFENRSGELARLCEAMAARGVNIVVCGAAHGGTGTVAFIADDERGARDALEGADIEYNERPALTIRMENVAGAGAKAFRKLADAGVNIDLLLPVRVSAEEFLGVVCAENLEAAASALGDQVVGDRGVLANASPGRRHPPGERSLSGSMGTMCCMNSTSSMEL